MECLSISRLASPVHWRSLIYLNGIYYKIHIFSIYLLFLLFLLFFLFHRRGYFQFFSSFCDSQTHTHTHIQSHNKTHDDVMIESKNEAEKCVRRWRQRQHKCKEKKVKRNRSRIKTECWSEKVAAEASWVAKRATKGGKLAKGEPIITRLKTTKWLLLSVPFFFAKKKSWAASFHFCDFHVCEFVFLCKQLCAGLIFFF